MKEQYEKEIKNKLDKVIIEELNKLKDIEDIRESTIKFDYLVNISKILDNYNKLMPILEKFFRKQNQERKFKQNESWDSISK